MAYDSKNFSVMAYANGFTIWNYQTADTLSTIKGSNYFDEAAPFIRKGDMIMATTETSGTIGAAILYVSNIADGVVSVGEVGSSAK